MKWLELKIDAAPAGLDPVSALLEDLGITGLVIDDEGDFRDFLEHVHDYLLRFSGSRAISHRNQRNAIFFDHSLNSILSSTDFFLIGRCCWVNNSGIQYLSGRIYNCQLTSGSKGRIPAKYSLSSDWRLHQKLL